MRIKQINYNGLPELEWEKADDDRLVHLIEVKKLSYGAAAKVLDAELADVVRPRVLTKNSVLGRHHRIKGTRFGSRGYTRQSKPSAFTAIQTLVSDDQCKFINASNIYCPSKATHGPWCEAHARMCRPERRTSAPSAQKAR